MSASAQRPFRVADDPLWRRRYEAVRALALSEATGGGWGLALLCRRGLIAWARSWPRTDDDATTRPRAAASSKDPRATALEPSLHDELIRMLANMILDSERRQSA